MKANSIRLSDVIQVYNGPELALWELLMGEQIHVGGRVSTLELAKMAELKRGSNGIDLCCCLGSGMRLLSKEFGVKMTGMDATPSVIEEAEKRSEAGKMTTVNEYVIGDVTMLPFDDKSFDFAWGEDGWCYVVDKDTLVEEAARVVKPGGKIAFTDWIEGSAGLDSREANRICGFMKFPYLESLNGYKEILEKYRFTNIIAEDLTEGFGPACDLYIRMLTEQLTTDALNIIGGNSAMFDAIIGEMSFMKEMALKNKMGRGRFVATKLPDLD